MAEETYKKRVRINVSTSVKGIKTWDATIEMIDTPKEEVLSESDALVAELDKRYPAQTEGK
jgi:hypothetical protein